MYAGSHMANAACFDICYTDYSWCKKVKQIWQPHVMTWHQYKTEGDKELYSALYKK